MSRANDVLRELGERMPEDFDHQILSPKSGYTGNLGLMLTVKKRLEWDVSRLCEIEYVFFAIES